MCDHITLVIICYPESEGFAVWARGCRQPSASGSKVQTSMVDFLDFVSCYPAVRDSRYGRAGTVELM